MYVLLLLCNDNVIHVFGYLGLHLRFPRSWDPAFFMFHMLSIT